jgi:hypothetical protein
MTIDQDVERNGSERDQEGKGRINHDEDDWAATHHGEPERENESG